MRFVIVIAISLVLPPLLLMSASKVGARYGKVDSQYGSFGVHDYTLPGPGGHYGFYAVGYGWMGNPGSKGIMLLADKWYMLPVSLPAALGLTAGSAALPWLALLWWGRHQRA
ncbi:MAG TPA: hypothetical protein VJA21_05370 [Verrucomicrobiae bacterium]